MTTRLSGWVLGGAVGLALVAACDVGFEVDDAGFCREKPEDQRCAGRGGSSGAGGAAGAAGAGGGAGGSPAMGQGGGGAGGSAGGACAGDAACADEKGAGSLCVADACTEAEGACDANLLVVVAQGRSVGDATLASACHYRDLDGARAAVRATTARIAIYADEAAATKALDFATPIALEGHHGDPSKAVALTLPQAALAPLVRFGQGGALKGVALNGGGTALGVRVEGGSLAVAGPTTVTNAALALELVGGAAATVTGAEAAPVRLRSNKRGVFVPAAATLVMRGDGKAESLVVEGTSGGGAAVLFEAAGTSPCSTLSKVAFRDNVGSSGDGTGAIEVRRGRQVVVDGCTFVHNRQSVTLSGAGGSGGSGVDAFLGVQLQNNVFTDALPLEPAGTGSMLCGSNLGSSDTTLNVRAGNLFPGDARAPAGPRPQGALATCAELPSGSQFGCDGGQLLGHSAPAMTIDLECVAGTFQCGGGT